MYCAAQCREYGGAHAYVMYMVKFWLLHSICFNACCTLLIDSFPTYRVQWSEVLKTEHPHTNLPSLLTSAPYFHYYTTCTPQNTSFITVSPTHLFHHCTPSTPLLPLFPTNHLIPPLFYHLSKHFCTTVPSSHTSAFHLHTFATQLHSPHNPLPLMSSQHTPAYVSLCSHYCMPPHFCMCMYSTYFFVLFVWKLLVAVSNLKLNTRCIKIECTYMKHTKKVHRVYICFSSKGKEPWPRSPGVQGSWQGLKYSWSTQLKPDRPLSLGDLQKQGLPKY